MSININSEAWCRKAYLNFHCYGNSMNISADEMGEITNRWGSKIESWKATVSNDENQYEFDDSDYSSYKENGKKAAQDQTGYEGGGKGKMIARGVGDCAGAVAGAASGVVAKAVVNNAVKKGTGAVANKVADQIVKNASGKMAEKTMEETAKQSAKEVGKSIGCIAGCVLGLATATAYMAKKPNKEQKEACDELQNVMANNQAALSETQADMENMANELIDLSDQANEANEDANSEVEEHKTEFDMYRESYEALKAKAESGEPLTEEEKALYQELIQYMTEAGELITETQEDATDVVGELYEDMGTYQEGYDYAAETMGEVEGTTDFAESFDGTTRTMCYVEAGAQGLNAASSAKSAYEAAALASSGSWAFGATAWAWAFAAMGASGAVMSGIGTAEQIKWAGEVGNEIDMRKDTQTFNTETMDVYDEEIDAYDGFMSGVEDLEIDMPDDLEVPEDTALPQTPNPSGVPDGTPDSIIPKKEEEEV